MMMMIGVADLGVVDLGVVHHGEETEETIGADPCPLASPARAVDGEEVESLVKVQEGNQGRVEDGEEVESLVKVQEGNQGRVEDGEGGRLLNNCSCI
jgi:hypothetical protein